MFNHLIHTEVKQFSILMQNCIRWLTCTLRFPCAHYSLVLLLDADGVVGGAGECSALCWTEADVQVLSSLDQISTPAVGGIRITGRQTPKMKHTHVF